MPRLVVIDDDPAVLVVCRRAFQGSDVSVLTAETSREGLALLGRCPADALLLDVHLPDGTGLDLFGKLRERDATLPVIFITACGKSETAIEAMKRGAFDYLQKPLDLPALRDLLGRAFESRRLMRTPVAMGGEAEAEAGGDVLVGRSPAMQAVYKAIGRVAGQDVTVLIRGESGTGKELIARAIYQHSERAARPFLAINCAAIPEALLESELFGHEKGAFTGADRQRIGKFEQCNGGTLLLDEIGDMPLPLQAKMLRLLQEQRFERLGGNQTVRTDVRLLAATHQDLEKRIAEGRFRADLYYRLNVFSIHVPPLRARAEDLPLLLDHFLARLRRELGRCVDQVAPEVVEALRRHPWPGNVRQLESALKQAVLQASPPQLVPADLPEYVRLPPPGAAAEPGAAEPALDLAAFIRDRLAAGTEDLYAEALRQLEVSLLRQVLEHTGANQVQAARILGIARNSLRKKMTQLGITVDHVVEADDAP
jgi:two-component system nitrogen regulation response regulator GlnG